MKFRLITARKPSNFLLGFRLLKCFLHGKKLPYLFTITYSLFTIHSSLFTIHCGSPRVFRSLRSARQAARSPLKGFDTPSPTVTSSLRDVEAPVKTDSRGLSGRFAPHRLRCYLTPNGVRLPLPTVTSSLFTIHSSLKKALVYTSPFSLSLVFLVLLGKDGSVKII